MSAEENNNEEALNGELIAYGDNINNDNNNNNISSGEYDSDTSLSSNNNNNNNNEINLKKESPNKSLMKILKQAQSSRYNPSNFDEEIMTALSDLDHPPNDKKSFIWGIILMFIASFLFSISTQMIKYNHSFGRESFEIFVFRMFIQLFVTTMVASISVVMNHYYCYQSVSMFSTTEYEYDDEEGNDTETDYDYESDAELGQLAKKHKHKQKYKNKNKNKNSIMNILRGGYKFSSGSNGSNYCCQIRCVCATVFIKFWKDSNSETKLYILLRGICGGTGAVCYYWSVAILPINDTIFILSLFPIFTTIFSYFILGENINKRHIFYLFIAMIGILLMCYPSFIFGTDDRDDKIYNIQQTKWILLIQGYGFAFISSICYGFVFIFIRLAYKAPTFSLIFSNGLFGLFEAILICILFKRFVPIPMLKDWLIAIGIGCIGYLAQNAENRSGKYVFASLTSIIRVTEVFWEYVWQNLIYSKPTQSIIYIQSIGAAALAFAIINIMLNKYNYIKDIEIENALEGVIDYEYDTQYDTDDINYIYHKKDKKKIKHKAANVINKICGNQSYEPVDVDAI